MPTYAFQKVNGTYLGPTGKIDLAQGAAVAEEGITIEAAGDKNTMTIGADGKGMHSMHADKSGKVTLRYLKTSPTNQKLQLAYDAQQLDPALWGKGVIQIGIADTGESTACLECAFKKKPTIEYKKEGEFIAWEFDTTQIETILGNFT